MEKRHPYHKRLINFFGAAFLFAVALSFTASAATLGPSLTAKLTNLPNSTSVGTVIVAFNSTNGLNNSHLNALRSVGILGGRTLPTLGMAAFPATAGQVRALRNLSVVRSIYLNDRLSWFNNESRVLTGVERARLDTNFTTANGGLPLSGQGNFSVVVNDSGIDATHADLQYPNHVIQNVQIVTGTDTLAGFTPLLFVENVPDTDLNVGHGTHCAGIVGGTGARSGGLYAGVAPGANLIGTGSGAVLFILNALGGFEYSLANQFRYNVRIISNSYGSAAAFDPNEPVNIASKLAHDRNIIVVFAAGNSGPGKNTNNRYAKAPWVIGVAAGTKEGGLAAFSSRGTPRSERLTNSDPNDDFDAPTITAPGTGREFESNAAKYSAAVVSTRSATNVFSNGLTDDAELAPAFVPFYTQISGTSMATPFIAGVCALLLDADITLTPDQIKEILTQTATRMPGYEDFEVGAGYINAYAAIDKVYTRNKPYGAFLIPNFNAQYSVTGPAPETFHIDYNPAATPGAGSVNSRTFTVQPGMSVLDVVARIDNAIETGDGNTVGILLTDPNGVKYSSGIALPVLDAPSREVIVKNPAPGEWLLEVRGVRGLAAAPNFSLPTSGAAAPGPVDGTITQQQFNLQVIADIQGHPAQEAIETGLKNRWIDIHNDNLFRPESLVARGDLANILAVNVPLRQSLGSTPRFTDVWPALAPIAEALVANGSTIRDYNFAPQGLMSASGNTFNPAAPVSRLDVAVAFVRALGRDAEAQALANTVVTANGQPLSDNAEIPGVLRGYVQLAIDKGLFEAFPAEVRQIAPGQFVAIPGPRFEPATTLTRATMATKLGLFNQAFVTGQ